MPSELRPAGVFVPLVTPFDEDGTLSLGALESLAGDMLEAGARGIVALATTGEPTSLDDEEREAVVATCARVCRDLDAMLIVGAGTNDTRTTIARHEALADVPEARASLAVVPYYVRPSEAAIVRHFKAVAARSPVPVVVYNIPYRTGRGLGAEALLELAATDNIAGVKQAGRNRRRHASPARRIEQRLLGLGRRRSLPLPPRADGRHRCDRRIIASADRALCGNDRVRPGRARGRGPTPCRGTATSC